MMIIVNLEGGKQNVIPSAWQFLLFFGRYIEND